MLDQNTDRMWYVIGAVIVGAAIIFLLNSTMPNLFASVGKTFEGKAEETTHVTDGIMPNTGGNLLRRSNIGLIYNATADFSDYPSRIRLSTSPEQASGIHLSSVGFEPNTQYVMRYKFQKVSGTLERIGGHADPFWGLPEFYLDGESKGSYFYDYARHPDKIARVADDYEVHKAVIYITTGAEESDTQFIYLQPNRSTNTPVTVDIFDWQIVKGAK